MEYVIKNREPADVLRYFEEISAIPRGSGNEKAIGEFLLQSRGWKPEWMTSIMW